MQTALVIMAAGLGTRFGDGIKQFIPVGPNGELIMEYSIYDAINAGFNKMVIIIRKDIHEAFELAAGHRISDMCNRNHVELYYAYQELTDLPRDHSPKGRTKPWGTGHAVLSARKYIAEPFAVVNADDFYGREAYELMHDALIQYEPQHPMNLHMIGFVLCNTLSANGGVTRGICRVDQNDELLQVEETRNIFLKEGCAEVNGNLLDMNSVVSMNMWGFTTEFLQKMESDFVVFLDELPDEKWTSKEFLLPEIIGEKLRTKQVHVKVHRTDGKWFGVTYKADTSDAVRQIHERVNAGEYLALS